MTEEIPIDYVEGVDETTVWLWPNSPDPTTVRFDRDEWVEIEEAADGNVEAYISRIIIADLKEH